MSVEVLVAFINILPSEAPLACAGCFLVEINILQSFADDFFYRVRKDIQTYHVYKQKIGYLFNCEKV